MATPAVRTYRDGDTIQLREFDARGVRLFGVEPADALARSVELSFEHFVYEGAGGEVVAVWGYGTNGFMASTAYGWLLTSPDAERFSKLWWLRESRRVVEYVLARWPRFEVSVLKDHEVSQSWLTWLGFRWVGETPDFYVLERTR